MSNNFYDKVYDSNAYSVELATLAEDVTFSEIKNIETKFFIKMLTPMVASDNVSVKNKAGTTSSNYITLTIPKYLLYNFIDVSFKSIKDKNGETHKVLETEETTYKIPKGTVFLVEFLGGEAEADKIYIVGISPYSLL